MVKLPPHSGRFVILLSFILVITVTLCTLFSGAGGSPSVDAERDLDNDGRMEKYSLVNFSLTITEGEQQLWKSPGEWKVENFCLGDIDNDGAPNLVFSLWKRGSFGTARPFWDNEEDVSYKNHLFVYKKEENNFKPVWCSSNLNSPIVSFDIKDADGDGLNELVVREGKYRQVVGERFALDKYAPTRTAIWVWDQWGFTLRNQGEIPTVPDT